ncbi:MAG: hypothetical protein COZ18_08585 [Flexibacter sp. CG_4_10_14_3_um_filter_32_15]|nr:MAG: hypothetical protein COZ18_08585 [Flexibacter sp. CG_4_10_14_3_um_filter_32_15]
MKLIFTLFIACFVCTSAFSQNEVDSLQNSLPSTPQDSTNKGEVIISASFYNRYIWRGVNFTDAPSIQALFAYSKGGFEIGTYGATTLNGDKRGYGNTIEIYATYKYKNFSVTIDDYFFYESVDSLNNYFEYGKNTTHFVEGRLRYDHSKFYLMTGYTLYSREADDTNGLYIEAGYYLNDYLKIVAGGVTSSSFLNFQDKGGITNIGIYGNKTVSITSSFGFDLQTALIVSPNYKHVADIAGVARNPIHFLIGITF